MLNFTRKYRNCTYLLYGRFSTLVHLLLARVQGTAISQTRTPVPTESYRFRLYQVYLLYNRTLFAPILIVALSTTMTGLCVSGTVSSLCRWHR